MVRLPEQLKKTLRISGMTCANCARIVEKSLRKVDGVKFAAVNLATNTAFVVLEKDVPNELLKKAVEEVGYSVADHLDEGYEVRRYKRTKRKTIFAISITAFMFVSMAFLPHGHSKVLEAVMLLLSAIAIFYAGSDAFRGAFIALVHKHTNMDTLITFGALTAWLTELLHFFGLKIQPFGMVGSMIITLHLVGRLIESYLRDKASKEVRALLELRSKNATVLTTDGEISVPLDFVREGDIVLVKPGERIPADGIIIEGTSNVDESMISGEPIPVTKTVGNNVVGGSMNVDGVIKIKVTNVGNDSFLSKMIALIQEVQGAKVPIQALADRITAWFVPVVIVLAFFSSVVWYFNFETLLASMKPFFQLLPWSVHFTDRFSTAVFIFLSTIVIACPCALGLATPMALIVGTSQAMKKGLLIRNAEVIQTMKDVGYVLFDKTGTITNGKPTVVHFELPQFEYTTVAYIASLSNHPLAQSVFAHLQPLVKNGFDKEDILKEFEEIKEERGSGISVVHKGVRYFVGKPKDYSIYMKFLQEGCSIVEVRKDDNVIGFFAISDTIREDSKEAVQRLKDASVHPVMVTGDNEAVAKVVGSKVGISEIFAGASPEDKVNIVRHFQSKGKKVLMVGDGINDAPALKAADIGVAIGSGSEIALESADVIIMKGGISKVVELIEISKITFSTIKKNLVFAFLYNVVAIPSAMLGFLHPVIAEGAMAMSSITVITISLGITRKLSKRIV
ncbi:heavy metal translocating P-type ATPase [Fervidobacterium thailandense]|uniref:heavy metal translocating P-type ATPase n=1 Tax=Fervidobacterium thailandense TaxID=1008305 RepID=UPI002409A481|nr:cation-translocating P-type ATPase [Fervidobacterium thailandense]